MSETTFDFSKRFSRERLIEFANVMQEISGMIGRRISSRGWCYIMEQRGYINKSQFDKVTDAINKCRKEGLLPVDFVAEEKAREFEGIQVPDTDTMEELLAERLDRVVTGYIFHTPEWWEDETYYIQMVVEKVDLVNLFAPVCRQYAIPIANSKGWSSISQRAEYARRFAEAEEQGLKCVLLYCGDHDPDGLRISHTLRSNLEDVKDVVWEDGGSGYDPGNLIIDRFGLNYQFIKDNGFTWIDNLVTGSGLNLASKTHKNHDMPYVQDYLKTIGARKCEANVVVTLPKVAERLCRQAIEKYLGEGSADRFREKKDRVRKNYESTMKRLGLYEPINAILKTLKDDNQQTFGNDPIEDDED